MGIKQISIFWDKQIGEITRLVRELESAGVDIRAICLADMEKFKIIRLIVSDLDAARSLLKNYGFTMHIAEVIVIQIPDKPGVISDIFAIVQEENIVTEYMYAMVRSNDRQAALIFRFNNNQRARLILARQGFTILEPESISQR